MSIQTTNPFADSQSYNVLNFAPEETVETIERVVEEEVETAVEKEKPAAKQTTKKEIEEVLDNELVLSDDEEVEKAKTETQAALEGDDEDFDYTALAKQNIKAGIWEDYEDSDTLTLDKESFKELWEHQENARKAQIKESIFSSLDTEDKEFLEFKKNGGNLDLYFQARQREQVVQNLDITTDVGKKNAVYTYYSNIVGWSHEKIMKHIDNSIKDLEIDEEAEYAYAQIEERVKSEKAALIASQQKQAEDRQKQFNEYKTSLKTTFKDNLEPNKVKAAVEAFTQHDPETGLTPIDKAFIAMKADPKKAAELWKYITDPDKYVEEASKKVVEQKELKTFFKLKGAKKSDSNPSAPIKTTKNTNPFL